MSVELLRRAAALMRERALGAQEQGNAPWTSMPTIDPDNDGWVVTLDLPDADWDTTIAACPYDYEGNEVAAHIASWHPIVAFAVADWLDYAAHCAVVGNTDPWVTHALTVARAYLGGS